MFPTAQVLLSDVNDSPPVLVEVPTACTSVTEFHPATDPVLSVRAKDADDPKTPNGKVRTGRKFCCIKSLCNIRLHSR